MQRQLAKQGKPRSHTLLVWRGASLMLFLKSCDAMSLCVEKVAAVECEYASDVARCDVDMNGTCQLDAGVLRCANYGRRGSTPD